MACESLISGMCLEFEIIDHNPFVNPTGRIVCFGICFGILSPSSNSMYVNVCKSVCKQIIYIYVNIHVETNRDKHVYI